MTYKSLKIGGFKVQEYFIREINIDKLYHLSNIKIELSSDKRQNLLLTGRMVQEKLRVAEDRKIFESD